MFTMATDLRTARGQATLDRLNSGATGALLKIYTAPRPASGAAITTQTLLGVGTFAVDAGTVTNGIFTADSIEGGVALADGEATWGRMSNSADLYVGDVDVATGGAEVIVNNANFLTGGSITILSCVITEGNA